MRDLTLDLDPSIGRRVALEQALRRAIRDGTLAAGDRLPSSRALAADLELARATVVAAYEQLSIEGYVIARPGAGTAVAHVDRTQLTPPDRAPERPALAADFRPGEPDNSLFPRSDWLRSIRRVLDAAPDTDFGYPHPRGMPALRHALAAYLGRTRAVHTSPSDVFVYGGVTSSFGFLAELFIRIGITRVAIEDPSLFILRDVLSLVGLEVVPVRVDDDGIDVGALSATGAQVVFVTPAHQYPTGTTMSPERRAKLVDWARSGRWIIEDDYDGEFRYDRNPIGALQGLDPDRVIHAGTASKSLAAGLRLSWLVVPEELQRSLVTVTHLRSGVSAIDQMALADFISSGSLDRQVRRARTAHRARRTELLTRLADDVGWLHVSGAAAGLHLCATTDRADFDEARLVAAAAEQGIGLLGLRPHWLGKPTQHGLAIGYSRPPSHAWAESLDTLISFLAAR